ncbi:GIY-YIG nuclease family protein [Maribacter sp.]|uniref:GIY-YIG nuclease family protein n=1 Tax=Maribacter sp. TaxID=1897614 RepID=UPI003C73308C
MKYVVYILFSERLDRYYCGQTNNLEKRLAAHNKGGRKYTSKGIPWILIQVYDCNGRSEAVVLERKIKQRGIKRYLSEN